MPTPADDAFGILYYNDGISTLVGDCSEIYLAVFIKDLIYRTGHILPQDFCRSHIFRRKRAIRLLCIETVDFSLISLYQIAVCIFLSFI